MKMKRLIAALCAAVMTLSLTACGGNAAPAQSTQPKGQSETGGESAGYTPEGEFNIRVFAGAGGIADTVTRIAAQGLQDEYGVTAIVNNVTGASGAVAAADMDSYDPSIHELSLVSMSLFTSTPLMNPELNINLDNYQMVGSLIQDEFVLLVSSKSGIKSWEDLVNYGKDNRIVYASNAPGGNTHLLQIALFGEAGLDAEALTSTGSNKDILAVMSGDAVVTSATITLAKSYVESGEMVPIAVFSEEPSTQFADYGYAEVPTVPSLGYDITIPSYNFLITRAGVPAEELEGLYKAIVGYRDTEAFKTAAAAANYTPDETDGDTLRSEIEKYSAVCKEIIEKYY